MGLKPEVTQAFSFLGITPDTEYSEAAKAYKKLALKCALVLALSSPRHFC